MHAMVQQVQMSPLYYGSHFPVRCKVGESCHILIPRWIVRSSLLISRQCGFRRSTDQSSAMVMTTNHHLFIRIFRLGIARDKKKAQDELTLFGQRSVLFG